jgi:hypothetical protein
LGAEKFLHLFACGALFFVEFAVAVLVKFFDHLLANGGACVAAGASITAAFAGAALRLCGGGNEDEAAENGGNQGFRFHRFIGL